MNCGCEHRTIADERKRIIEEVKKLRKEEPWPLFVTAADMAEAARTANNNVIDDVILIVNEQGEGTK